MPPPDVIHAPNTGFLTHDASKAPRIVTRRGSLSAPDPYGEHSSEDKPRHVRSRLTVMRVPSESVDLSSPATSPPVVRPPTRALSHPTPRGRLSFSTSSFSTSPEDKRHSYTSSRARRHSGSQVVRRPSLSAQQICDLASTSLSAPIVQPANPIESAFRRVPASYYLPFIDRPTEIEDLLSSNANARLMTLLSLTFSVHNRDVPGDYTTQEPITWSYATLRKYMTQVDRSTANDIEWLHNVRQCIRTHSEIMWERIKDVLGVLPELDSDDPFYPFGTPEEAIEVAVDLKEAKIPSPDEATEFGVNEAWLEPIYVLTDEEIERERRLSMSPGSMDTIGEVEEAEEAEEQVVPIDEYKTQTTDEELMATRSIGGLKFHTDYLFVRGTAPTEKKVEIISTPDATTPASNTVPRIQVTSPDVTTVSPLTSPSSSPRTPPQIRRWATSPAVPSYIPPIEEEPEIETEVGAPGEVDHDIIPQPTETVPIMPIAAPPLSAMERRRHSIAVEPRFPTTFAGLQSSKVPLAQRVVHAGVVH